jgi:hypothetical protein
MISIAGTSAIVFGTNAAHDRALLKAACEAQGWTKLVTRPPSQHRALDAAVRAVASRYLEERDAPLSVRALEEDLSFEAVRVKRGTPRNTVIHLCSAQLEPVSQTVRLLDCNQQLTASEVSSALQTQYDSNVRFLAASQVRGVVASVVRRLQGVALGAANLYYLPHDAMSAWATWRDAAQMWRYHTVPFQVASDPATVEHIISQLNVEVSEQSQLIIAAVEQGGLEPRQAKALAKKAQAIIDKIESYEKALGQQLDWMRGPLETAKSALAVSHLLSVSI